MHDESRETFLLNRSERYTSSMHNMNAGPLLLDVQFLLASLSSLPSPLTRVGQSRFKCPTCPQAWHALEARPMSPPPCKTPHPTPKYVRLGCNPSTLTLCSHATLAGYPLSVSDGGVQTQSDAGIICIRTIPLRNLRVLFSTVTFCLKGEPLMPR